jgi:hypothetical protein
MNLKACASGVALLVLTASVAGCSPLPLPGPLHYGHCGPNAHTESFPHAKDERHAYACRSDDNGFLESDGQGDQRRN